MIPKNCNECKHHNNCNSYYGGLGCRYKITPILLVIVIIISINTTITGVAESKEIPVVEAEDIGIHTISSEPETPDPVEEVSDPVDVDAHTQTQVEGYVENTYFEPNTFYEDDEVAYICTDHEYAYSVYYDDDYVYEEWCIICGHGTETPITDAEFDALGINTDEEYYYD